jgi:hypothetical protein
MVLGQIKKLQTFPCIFVISNFYLLKIVLWGVVAHVCNPSYLGGGDRRIVVWASSSKKIKIKS